MSYFLKVNNDLNHFENDFCRMEIKKEILHCVFFPFLLIDERVAEIIVRDRIKFSKGKPYRMLMDISNLKYITREGREYLASEIGIKNIIAGAYVATSQNEKLLWNMFLNINRPATPSQIFEDKKEALKWLELFK